MLSAEEQVQVNEARQMLEARNTFCLGSEVFGVRRFLSEDEDLANVPRFAFAEDDCGNFFVRDPVTGQVGFWDHETAETTKLAESLSVFLGGLVRALEFRPKPGQVKHVWVHPDLKKGK